MTTGFNQQTKISVLGGGQLGRMLQIKAHDYNVSLAFMDSDKNAPCNGISHKFVVGDLNNFDHVVQFGKNSDVVTIEIENVNIDALKHLENNGVKVFPQPHIIELIKDKGKQKQFYQNNQIPTTPFYLIDDVGDLMNFSNQFPMVQKLRTGGYDGKGVMIIDGIESLSNAFQAPSILEEKVNYTKELSVIVSRNENGEVATFPCVEQEFNSEANLVEFLFSPAEVSDDVNNKAEQIATDLIEKLEMVGILAVELFLTNEGELLVNEIAPRPHNSGHHTIEANYESQYGQLLRCLLNLPLGDTTSICPAVMVNLLGEKGFEGPALYEGMNETLAIPGVFVHLYGKSQTKAFRKMGHATLLDKDIVKAKEKAKLVKSLLKIISIKDENNKSQDTLK